MGIFGITFILVGIFSFYPIPQNMVRILCWGIAYYFFSNLKPQLIFFCRPITPSPHQNLENPILEDFGLKSDWFRVFFARAFDARFFDTFLHLEHSFWDPESSKFSPAAPQKSLFLKFYSDALNFICLWGPPPSSPLTLCGFNSQKKYPMEVPQ